MVSTQDVTSSWREGEPKKGRIVLRLRRGSTVQKSKTDISRLKFRACNRVKGGEGRKEATVSGD